MRLNLDDDPCASKGSVVGVDSATDAVSTSTSVGDTVDGSTTELDTDTGASGDDECVVPPPGGTWPECPNTGGAGGWIDTIERSIVYDLPTASLCTVTAIEADGSYGYTLTFLCGGEEWQQYFGGVPRVPVEVGDPCGEENPTEYDLVAIFLDPAFKYP